MSGHSTYILLFKLTCAISLIGLCVTVFGMSYGKYNPIWGGTWIQHARAMRTIERTAQTPIALRRGAQRTENDTPKVVIFNVLPKSGSRTLDRLVAKLDKNITMLNTMNSIDETQEEKFAIIRRAIRSNRSTFVYSHTRYEWMGPYGPAHGVRKPIYVSVVRDPIERLASAFYFARHGDNMVNESEAAYQFRESMKTRNFSNETFDQCVLRYKFSRGCRNPGVFVKHFSGYKHVSLQRALNTIDRHYSVVGIMEDYESFLSVLERKIPEVFEGVVALYKEEANLVASMKTKNKRRVSQRVKDILRKEMTEDYEVYDAVKSRFEKLKLELDVK